MESARRKEREGVISFPIALHPPLETGDSEPVLTGLPNRKEIELSHPVSAEKTAAPFSEPPKRNRNNNPAYSWPPHLYREVSE